MHIRLKNLTFVFSAMLAAALLTCLLLSLPDSSQRDVFAQDSGPDPRVNRHSLSHAEGLSTAFRNVAELLRPSVVSISTRTELAAQGRRGIPPGFEDFFGAAPQPREANGMGSGVIVRDDGYILTNNHVVKDADELMVELFDGRKISGKIVGTDPQTDLAVVKIDLTGLRAANFGSSEDIQVGDWVLAIGSPFGLDQTVTAGIISGKNRVQRIIDDGNGFEDFLQTDAAINPGNSGGPLVNLRGELVGINTAILSRTGASTGIGFAIPASLARPVLRSIIETGVVRRGFLGAQVVDVTPDAVRDFELAVNTGALIGKVLEDQPAADAGLKPGDVVTKLDGRPVAGGTQLRNYIASRPPGSTVAMEVNRGGRSMKVRVSLRERTDAAMAMFRESGGLFGAQLVPVTPETARQYGYENLRSGLIVAAVEDGSAAAEAQLQVGDVIESAAGLRLKSVDQLAQLFEESKRRGLPLRCVIRRGKTQFLLVIR
jgi:serine protease Do